MKAPRQTSIDCYNKIREEGLLSNMRLIVLNAILENAPCTTSEALQNTKRKSIGFGSRFTELRNLGVIKEVGTKKCTVTGRTVIEWDYINSEMFRQGVMFADIEFLNNL